MTAVPPTELLTPSWTHLEYHKTQNDYWNCDKRFIVSPAGRRSGKTEIAKRKLVKAAMFFSAFSNGRFICSAPTQQQAKEIFWTDLLSLIPKWAMARDPVTTPVPTIFLWNGARIQVIGLDKAARIEGSPVDGIVLDEYGNMKEKVWKENIRPALSTRGRPGWAILIGVPEGRNHYYRTALFAQDPTNLDWAYFHWKSSEILPAFEIEAAKNELDELTYKQEYEGDFVTFAGCAYYGFDRAVHCIETGYDPNLDLILCFDFNRSPGVAVVVQEQQVTHHDRLIDKTSTVVLDEVWIGKDSNTIKVCNQITEDWEYHKKDFLCYGDATGGAKTSSSVLGSDWDLIEGTLTAQFGDRVKLRNKSSNPRERVRVNAMNGRMLNTAGRAALFADPIRASHVVEDLEGVTLKENGSGELDKTVDPQLTHISDALGYYIAEAYPAGGTSLGAMQI